MYKLFRLSLALIAIVMLALVSAGGASAAEAEYSSYVCSQPGRLAPGGTARVTLFPNQPNRVRNNASFQGTVLGYIPAGGVFTVLSGPYCDGFTNWWQVNYAGLSGYTAEGDGFSTYWLEPISYTPPPPTVPPPACSPAPRLAIGSSGRVTPGLPNTLRSGPGVSGTARIGRIPATGIFTLISGPNCASDGRWWWQVNYQGLVGWTAEGQGNVYWLEPWGYVPPPTVPPPSCVLANRLAAGGIGRVTPGLPNILRSAPGTQSTGANSVVIGSIPGGGVFSILSGPQCGSDGRWWWQVNYQGVIGWTAEGEGYSTYWLEPAY